MKDKTIKMAIVILSMMVSYAMAHPSYIGYSGAPGSNGTCSGSCHGTSGGSIQVNGFPSEYIPGQTYNVMLSHSGGNSIRQFNGSCRIGSGSQNAGVISSGTNTATYNTSGETNGVHLSSNNMSSCMFHWTAPESGTGQVRLYIAGHQGSYSGQNTVIELVSDEQATGIPENDQPNPPINYMLTGCYPNPFNASTVINYELPAPSYVKISIFDLLGREVVVLDEGIQPAGRHSVNWNASNQPSGVYFARLQSAENSTAVKMVLLK